MSLVNPKQYIISARSNGYKDTAYAIAELADNSIQAEADKVEVLLFEGGNRNVQEIAIVDNGKGMSRELLASALGFGESGRDKDIDGNVQNDDASGMGKFGMGLPNASVSQCKRVEVWSWKNKGEINYSYLDVQEIIDGTYTDLPAPTKKEIPEKLLDAAFDGDLLEAGAGTIVLWSKLDKLTWKRSRTLFEKSEFEIGRMYRNFIASGKCQVQFKAYDLNGTPRPIASSENPLDGVIKANDPLYLTPNSSLPPIPGLHIDESPTFFEEKESDYEFQVDFNGKKHTIVIRSSIVRQEIIEKILKHDHDGKNKLGDTIFGKHCEKNLGLSVMRAGRELELIKNEFYTKSDINQPRFTGLEIHIPPSLDEVFGVTNNKQHANNLKDISNNTYFDGDKELKTKDRILAYLEESGDQETAILYDVSVRLSTVLTNRKKELNKLSFTKRTSDEYEQTEDDAPTLAIDTTFKKRDETHVGTTLSEEPNYQELEDYLVDDIGYEKQAAAKVSKKMEDLKSRVRIEYTKTSSNSFFEVENLQGITVLVINDQHDVYTHFLSQMNEKDKTFFKVMLGAWARLEDETQVARFKNQLENARGQWSAIIEDMFEELLS